MLSASGRSPRDASQRALNRNLFAGGEVVVAWLASAGAAASMLSHNSHGYLVLQLSLVAPIMVVAHYRAWGAAAGVLLGLVVAAGMLWLKPDLRPDRVALMLTAPLILLPVAVARISQRYQRSATLAAGREALSGGRDGSRAVEMSIRAGEARFRSLLTNASDVIFVLDRAGTVLYVSPSVTHLLGLTPDDLVRKSFFLCLHPGDELQVRNHFAAQLADPGKSAAIQFSYQSATGSWRSLEASFSNLLEEPSVAGVVVNARDVTERMQFQDHISYLAYHDPLTGLPNRTLLLDRLNHASARVRGRHHALAVLFLDLDRFKLVNDTFGHAAGDHLLLEVGRLLSECVRPGDTVARLGGDEFAVLLEDLTSTDSAFQVAGRILQSISKPLSLGGSELTVGTSIGIAFSGDCGAEPSDLLRAADMALYRAKAAGRGGYAVFDPSMAAASSARLALETDLRAALDRNELRVHYQPIVRLADRRASGVEALVRWQHPERGLLLPSEFIPLAEETGLIVPLGRMVLEEACRQSANWQHLRPDPRPFVVAVNLSPRQFRHPGLVDDIARLTREHQLKQGALQLEITESAMMDDVDEGIATLGELKRLGVRLAIDDFGTGYSSLSYLKRLPVDTLKIDRSFIEEISGKTPDAAIVRGVVDLGRSLNLTLTGEGVETAAQCHFLSESGCDQAQGFLFSRAIPADDLSDLLLPPTARRSAARRSA